MATEPLIPAAGIPVGRQIKHYVTAIAAIVALTIAAATTAPNARADTTASGGATAGVAPSGGSDVDAGSSAATGPAALDEVISSVRDVKALQRALHVRADGTLGPKTRSALRRVERTAGLPADGVPRRSTLAALGITLPARPPRTIAADETATGVEPAIVAAARTRIGSPYEWGSTGPHTFDCSGLVTWSAQHAGLRVPRVSFDQFETGEPVKRADIQAGDLVFFDTDGAGASDVGIATGPTTEISATSSRGVVEHPIFDSYWGSHFVGARRIH